MRKTVVTAVVAGIVGAIVATPVVVYASHSFIDVSNTNTFHADIAWLRDSGVTKGCNPPANTQFCPDDSVTRGQMAAFMHRLAENRVVDAGTLDGLDGDQLTVVAAADIDSDLPGTAVSEVTTINEVKIDVPSDGILIINGAANVGVGGTMNPSIKPYVDNTAVGAYGSFDFMTLNLDDSDRFDNLSYTTAAMVPAGTHTVRQDIGQLFADGLIGAQLQYNANSLTVLFVPGGKVTAAATGEAP